MMTNKKLDEDVKRKIDKFETQALILFGIIILVLVIVVYGIVDSHQNVELFERMGDNQTEILEYKLEHAQNISMDFFVVGALLVLSFVSYGCMLLSEKLFLCRRCKKEVGDG